MEVLPLYYWDLKFACLPFPSHSHIFFPLSSLHADLCFCFFSVRENGGLGWIEIRNTVEESFVLISGASYYILFFFIYLRTIGQTGRS